MVEKTLLRKIGLTDNEAEVYLILLKLEEALASGIASQTRISRPHVYDSLNKLIEKGLASYVIKNSKKYFRAASPHKLIDYLKEKQSRLKDEEKEVTEALPALLALHKPKEHKPVVEVYEGKEGMKTVLDDIIKTCKDDPKASDFVGFGESAKRGEEIAPYAFKKYMAQRKKYKIPARFLYTEGVEPLGAPYSKYRPIPKDYSSKSMTITYGNKTAIWIWLEKRPLIIRIQSPDVSQTYRSHFEMMWKQETRVLRGLDGVKEFLKDVVKTGKDSYYMGVSGEYQKRIPRELNEYFEGLKKKGLKEHLIVPAVTDVLHTDVSMVKYVPKEYFSPVDMAVYGKKIAIVNWKDPITVLMMENEAVAESFMKYFRMIWEQESMVFKGIDGMRLAMDIMLRDGKRGDCLYVCAAPPLSKETDDFFEDFNRRRSERGIHSKMLFTEEAKRFGEKRRKFPVTEVRYAPRGVMSLSALDIFKDRVAIVLPKKKEPVVFLIENRDVAQSMKVYFDFMWERKTWTYEGLEEIFGLFYSMLEELKPGEAYHVMGAGYGYSDIKRVQEEFIRFHKARQKKGVKVSLLFNDDTRKLVERRMAIDFRNASVKFTPPKMKTPMQIVFYKDKTFMVLWNKEPPTAFLIEDKAVAQSFKDYYKMLDTIAKP